MSKHVLILNSSPRIQGNSVELAAQFAAGAGEAGARVETFSLANMKLYPCDGCDLCRESGACAINDDMQKLYPRLLEAEVIALASPIYWFTYCAQLKMCIDRWYALWNLRNDAFQGKTFAFILTYGDSDVYTSGAINAIHTFETMCRFLQARVGGWVYGSLSDIGDALKHPELLQQAYALGVKLARG